ncbi:uncharacterized protein TNCT_90081 [Trichonephila clavata]|uniref:Uncharacterized protein n=1 Tax=Trichonephila clavata TaxID=2740835 RepID=A0A8X6F0X4_TRICU|nr:uncharacterized protein TNCT_483431 [Trichonephila clavata]GFR31547.1 uncharacterized protein TNCT_90081 [Trichonephila clavata]
MGPSFEVPFLTEERDRAGFCPFALSQVSVPAEPALGHLRCLLTDVPPQTNCLPDTVFGALPRHFQINGGYSSHNTSHPVRWTTEHHRISNKAIKVVVFHRLASRKDSHLDYANNASPQSQTTVKLERVFFPR